MDSEQNKQKPKNGMSGFLIAVIVISIAAVIGALIYYYFKNGSNSFRNVGTPNLAAVAPPAVPSMTNVTGGNMGATGGNARPSANIR